MNNWRSLGVLVLAMVSAGCRATFDYPDSQNESTPSRCSNGTDDDFDGIIDCDDPSCDGYCLEQDVVRCGDGRDNDGDGLIDARDARCWHLAGPTALRCASLQSVDFEERFDGVLSETRWAPFGYDPVTGDRSAGIVEPLNREDRPNTVLGLAPLSDDAIPTGLTSKVLFDGDWTSFELAFQGMVDGGGGLQVALAPADLAPSDGPPLDGALHGSLALSVRGDGGVVVIADGAEQDATVVSRGAWHDFRLERSGDSLSLTVDDTIAYSAQSPSASASRIVVWGDTRSQLDDLHLRVAGETPCGVAAPQIPLCDGCAKDVSVFADDVGMAVSVARDGVGAFCAVTTEGDQGAAVRGSSWLSDEGKHWQPGGALVAGLEGDLWMGAAVARDSSASLWRGIVITHGVEGAVMHRLASADCKEWKSEGSLPLPEGAHSPSYLIPGVLSQHELYFASDPSSDRGPSLWRYRSDDGDTFYDDGIEVVSFPIEAEMESPISITRAGPHDVILSHRIAPKTGTLGLGLWVAEDDALSQWRQASNYPLLQSDPRRGGFDGNAVVSGTLYWDGQSGFTLYGARGEPVGRLHQDEPSTSISIGTASLLVAGGQAPEEPFSEMETPQSHAGTCGNHACEGDETCSSCPIDCGVCDGELIVADAFEDPSLWSHDATEAPSVYISQLANRLALSPGAPQWWIRELPDVVVGDFELSFDVHWVVPEGATQDERCPALLGLARASDDEDVAEGVFVQLDQQLPCQPGTPAFSPLVGVGRSRFTSLEVAREERTCEGMLTGIREAWHHVVLQRTAGQARLHISAGPRCEGAETGRAISTYAGPIDGLDRVAVGWGRSGWTESCSTASAGLSIDNLVVRTLPCPQGGKSCTDSESGKAVCVDLSSSPEHCGGCNERVEAGERCKGGEATCAGELCPVGDTGMVICTDTKTSPNHCGKCGREVGTLEVCDGGIPVAAMVALPDDYEMDATEVTMGQYDAWLATEPLISDQHPACTWNETFKVKCLGAPTQSPRQPVTCINWCDAFAYCAGVGKRLCLGEEWMVPCIGGSAGNTYPYGGQYDPLACNGADTQHEGSPMECAPMLEVGAKDTCQSSEPAYRGIYDLSGNAWEWVDNCLTETGEHDKCELVGGSNCEGEYGLECTALYSGRERVTTSAKQGFRCCR